MMITSGPNSLIQSKNQVIKDPVFSTSTIAFPGRSLMPKHSVITDLRALFINYTTFTRFFQEHTGLLGAILLVCGLCFSTAMMSIGVILIGIQAVFPFNFMDSIKHIKSHPLLWLMVAYYLIPFIALTYTQNQPELLKHQQTVLPIFVLPIGLLAKPLFHPRQQRLVSDIFIVSVFATGFLTFIYYLLNLQAMNEQLSLGKKIPIITGVNHIYYSVFSAFATLLGFLRLIQQKQIHGWWKWTLIAMTLANLVFLHVFTTRTGLCGFYLAVGILLFIGLIRKKQYLFALGGIMALGVVGIMAVALLPSLHTQYKQTKEDLGVYLKGENPNYYSLSTRLKAWETGWYLIKKNPVIGVGAGSFAEVMDSAYKEKGTLLLPQNRIRPHNQYLESTAQNGIPGFLTLCGMLIWPVYLIGRKQYSATGLAFLVLIGFACLAESILERQAGATFFAFFLPWIFYQVHDSNAEPVYDEPESGES